MSDAVVLKVGGVNPSGAAAVVNPTPESEMDALLLGRTGVSDRTRFFIHPHVTLTFVLHILQRVFLNEIIDLQRVYENAPPEYITFYRKRFRIILLLFFRTKNLIYKFKSFHNYNIIN